MYIVPVGQELELVFEDNTSLHIIEFLNILSKDPKYLRSIIRIPSSKNVNKPFPHKIWISTYKNEKQNWMILDTSIVVDENDAPIYAQDSDELCLWPSYVIKAWAKIFWELCKFRKS